MGVKMQLAQRAGQLVAIVVILLSVTCLPVLAEEAPVGEWVHFADDTVFDAAAAGDGSLVAIASRDNKLTVYDGSSELLWEFVADDSVRAVDVSEDGAYIAIAGSDRFVRLFNAQGELLWAYRSSFPMNDVAISQDGEYVSAASITGKNLVFLNRAGELLWDKDLISPVESTAMYGVGDSTRPLAGTRDARVYVLSKDGDELLRMQLNADVMAVAVSRTGSRIAVALGDGTVALLNGGNGTVLWRHQTRREKSSDRALAIGMDDNATLIMAGVTYGKVFMYDGEGQLLQEQNRKEAVECAYVSRDGETLIIGGRDNYATVVHVEVAAAQYAATQRALRNGILAAGGVLVLLVAGAVLTVNYTRWGSSAWHTSAVPARRLARRIWRSRYSYVFLIPTFALLLAFNYYPAFSGLWHGFTRWTPGLRAQWIGLSNYQQVLRNRYFFAGVQNAIILVVTGFAKLAFPLLVAELIFNLRWTKVQYWLRTSFIVPLVVPGVVSILLWVNIYDPNYGMLNQTLRALNLGQWTRVWLGETGLALWSIVFMGFPWVGAFPLLLFYGGLISIPTELFDAAKVDGATSWRRFWYIDLPLLMTPLKTLLVLGFIGGVQAFSEVFLTTGGGPGHATYTPALEMYYQATRFNRMGMASAMGTVLFIVILGGTIINLKYIGRSATEYQG
jgi:ABC-type sugar transport system permease subunit/outer membrane protein assembly factor BamB